MDHLSGNNNSSDNHAETNMDANSHHVLYHMLSMNRKGSRSQIHQLALKRGYE